MLCVVSLGRNNMFQQLLFNWIYVQKNKDILALVFITSQAHTCTEYFNQTHHGYRRNLSRSWWIHGHQPLCHPILLDLTLLYKNIHFLHSKSLSSFTLMNWWLCIWCIASTVSLYRYCIHIITCNLDGMREHMCTTSLSLLGIGNTRRKFWKIIVSCFLFPFNQYDRPPTTPTS